MRNRRTRSSGSMGRSWYLRRALVLPAIALIIRAWWAVTFPLHWVSMPCAIPCAHYAHNKKLSPGDFRHPEINFRHLPPGRIKLSQTFATLPSLFKLSSRRTFGQNFIPIVMENTPNYLTGTFQNSKVRSLSSQKHRGTGGKQQIQHRIKKQASSSQPQSQALNCN